MPEGSQDYLSMLYTEKDIAKSLPYKGEIKLQEAKKKVL
jgi:hypothetical protein